MKHLFIAPLALVASMAQATTAFDTFEGDRYSASFGLSPFAPLRADRPSSQPGITRSLEVQPTPGADGSIALTVSGNVLGDLLLGGANGDQRLSVTLSYGLDAPMNFDFSGSSAFQLLFYYGGPLKLTVYAYTDAPNPADNPLGSALTLDVGPHYQSVLTLPLADFRPNDELGQGVNWANVDRLSFAFSEADASSRYFGLYSIALQPVPEPMSAALMLLGLPLLWARRRGDATR